MIYLFFDIESYKNRIDNTEYLFYKSLENVTLISKPQILEPDSFLILISNFYTNLDEFGINRDQIILFIWDLYCTNCENCICNKCKFQTVLQYINANKIKHVMYRFDTLITRTQLMASTNYYTYKFPYFIPEINSVEKKDIDILFYGAVYPTVYPFRRRILDILEKHDDNEMKIHIIMPGEKRSVIVKPPELYDYISRSWLVVATPSIMHCLLLKYYEIAACGSVVFGKYPKYEPNTPLKENLIEITEDMPDETIKNKLKSALLDKKSLINSAKIAREYVNSKYLFKHGQIYINNIIENVIINNSKPYLYTPFNGMQYLVEPKTLSIIPNSSAKKICVAFFNCHGEEYLIQLQQCPTFFREYQCFYIFNVKYLNEPISKRHIKLISKADVLLLQYIQTPRKFIHHDIVKQHCKKECQIFLLPHYTFSGYTEDTEKELLKFREFDKISSIKISELFELNYKNVRLFQSRSYPTDMFFHIAALEILREIYGPRCVSKRQLRKIVDETTWKFTNFARHTKEIILPNDNFAFHDEDEVYCGIKLSISSILTTKKEKGSVYRNVPEIIADMIKNESNSQGHNLDYF